MLVNSEGLITQVPTLIVYMSILAIIGGIWARAHVPVTSIMIALQLGIMAPSAVSALVFTSIETSEASELTYSLQIPELGIASAHAHTIPLVFQQDEKPTIFKCIVKALVAEPC